MAQAGTSSVHANSADALEQALDHVEQVFAANPLPGTTDVAERRPCARRLASAAVGTGSDLRPQDIHTARLFYTADLLAMQALELVEHRDRATELIEQLIATGGFRGHALARAVLRSPSLLGLPPAMAIEVQLGLAMAFAPLREVSLWMTDPGGGVREVNRVGAGQARAPTRELAGELLSGRAPSAERETPIGFAIRRWEEPAAALVGVAQPGKRDRCHPVLEEAAPVLGAILERETLMSHNVTAERVLSETHERRLTRLGFDIHDGPLQDLALLAEDVHLLRRQLTDVLPPEVRHLMLGRLDDLDAQLVSLDSDLRRISGSLQSPLARPQPLPDVLADMARAFASRSSIHPVLATDGDLENLTDSQQTALLSIAREALNNVREHSEASGVTISLTGTPTCLELKVTDDGCGFDVEQTLVQAARDGRFGLVGLHERARLLGGSSRIESKPGHPTTITVTLPRWRPVAPEEG